MWRVTSRCTSTRMAHPHCRQRSPARCPSTWMAHQLRMSRTRAASHRDAAGGRAAACARTWSNRRSLLRGHRKHRRRAQPDGRDPSSAASQRPLLLQRADAPPRRRDHGAGRARLAAATGRIAFVPHSGPFARGIHMTVQGRADEPSMRVASAIACLMRPMQTRRLSSARRAAADQGRGGFEPSPPARATATTIATWSWWSSTTWSRVRPAAPCSG